MPQLPAFNNLPGEVRLDLLQLHPGLVPLANAMASIMLLVEMRPPDGSRSLDFFRGVVPAGAVRVGRECDPSKHTPNCKI